MKNIVDYGRIPYSLGKRRDTMEKKIALLCDSGADLSEQEAKELGIYVVRMNVTIDEKEYTEGVDLSEADIYRAHQEGSKITTAQPSTGVLMRMWDELLESYDQILYLPISRELSGTCANAMALAKSEYEGRVFVVDSTFVCYPAVVMLKEAKAMLEKGYSCEEVKAKLEEGEMLAILIPENLNALKAGGRISPAAAALAGMLKIFPLLKVENGSIDVQEKVRTAKKAYAVGIDYLTSGIDVEDYEWMIIHADNDVLCDTLKRELEEKIHLTVDKHIFRSIILSHVGKGTIGFGRIKKLKY